MMCNAKARKCCRNWLAGRVQRHIGSVGYLEPQSEAKRQMMHEIHLRICHVDVMHPGSEAIQLLTGSASLYSR